ncbi:MAG: hypothetical protein HUJ58_06720, partial [Erysipelotrichaceae bacterium]|nr:hypothetical protein [Erysipelotrichaceae bacterium]
MDAIYTRQLQLPMSYCNHLGRLSYTDTCTIFMNAACDDAQQRGFGLTYIQQRNLFWLTVHAKYRFYRMPAMLTDLTVQTWPGKLRFGLSKRYYTLQDENGLCAEALTDWALYDNSEQKIT